MKILTRHIFYTISLATLIVFIQTSELHSQSGWFWQHPYPQGDYIEDMCFINKNTGWAVTSYQLLNTTNAGLNWSISTNKDRDAVSLTFINENTGWLGGRNVVYKTTNGGNNWSTQTIPDMWGYPDDIYFLNSQTGYALTDEVIFKTTNGGTNWNYSLYNGYRQFNSFDFYGSSYGWVCCDSGKFY